MEAYFDNSFEDVQHERSLILLLSVVEQENLRQSKHLDHEKENIKKFAPDKLHRQRNLEEIFALDF